MRARARARALDTRAWRSAEHVVCLNEEVDGQAASVLRKGWCHKLDPAPILRSDAVSAPRDHGVQSAAA